MVEASLVLGAVVEEIVPYSNFHKNMDYVVIFMQIDGLCTDFHANRWKVVGPAWYTAPL